MNVYSEREEIVDPRKEIAAGPDAIRFGQIESGVADALCPTDDRLHPVLARFRRVAVGFPNGLHELLSLNLPRSIRIKPPEGFAYYALYPEQYIRAARHINRPAVVIGIRSIGTTLSAAVARELDAESITVRPRGHPFDRQLHLSDDLENWIRQRRSKTWVVVDEGPGISGSSFGSVSRKLRELGAERIVFLPGWDAPADLLRAPEEWRRYPHMVETYRPHLTNEPLTDLSAGMWRRRLDVWPAVHPQHERVKLLGEESKTLFKFAGLGWLGSSKLERASGLAEFIPKVEGFVEGFLRMRFVEGRPVVRLSADLSECMADYLARLRESFTTRTRSNLAMFGLPVDFPPCETVAVDGRMLPHEWIETREGFLKTDALDHHDDHFFPGCQDIAWDVAGAIVEFRMTDAEQAAFEEAYLRRRSEVYWEKRLRFHIAAYSKYRAAYAHLAQQTLGESDDAIRFAKLERYYRERMALATGLFHSSKAS